MKAYKFTVRPWNSEKHYYSYSTQSTLPFDTLRHSFVVFAFWILCERFYSTIEVTLSLHTAQSIAAAPRPHSYPKNSTFVLFPSRSTQSSSGSLDYSSLFSPLRISISASPYLCSTTSQCLNTTTTIAYRRMRRRHFLPYIHHRHTLPIPEQSLTSISTTTSMNTMVHLQTS